MKQWAEIEQQAFDAYQSGYHCAEVIAKIITAEFSEHPATGIPQVASGFGGGMGRTLGDACGILTGGIIALGYLYGRKAPDANINMVFQLTAEWRRRFEEKIGTTQCPVILKNLGEQENAIKCKKLTAEMAGILAELVKENRKTEI